MSAEHNRKTYFKVAGILTLFTALEIGVVYTSVDRKLIIAALIGLAVSKALAVALYYMHLKSETKYLRMILGLPMLMPPIYAVVLMLEAIWHTTFYTH
jgi:cytochrome c oxidase subunit IV